ncbi:AraC family transcriptional regulator [Novosphingobium sp. Chol11]|uniref:helix-turn-helix domain-containing protein n=1 Tax=Novosphingobium sp. Chol11 TaxID=1385763 RepID=UPI0025D44FAC|nr:AraC family transcriptional regulator [Novosphingobium sp. Chol11]
MGNVNRQAPALFTYFEPSTPLQGLVAFHYRIEVGDAPLDAGICSLLGQLQITLSAHNAYDFGVGPEIAPAAALLGPTTRAARLIAPAGSVAIGSALTPAGWNAIIGASASSAAHRVACLSTLLGDDADRLPSACLAQCPDKGPAVLDSFLRAKLRGRMPDPRIAEIDAWVLLDGEQSADALASVLAMSRRSLERFTAMTHGAPPKLLAAKYRALKAAARIAAGEVSDWRDAAELGDFVDQSHFIRHFKRHVCMTPRAFNAAQDSFVHRLILGRWQPGKDLGIAIWAG